jgi:hypothetical protein
MPKQNTRDENIAKYATGPDPRPLEDVDILELVCAENNKSTERPMLYGPGNRAAAKAKAWKPTDGQR